MTGSEAGTSPGAKPCVTVRETQVLHWIAAGKSDWEIGQILNISAKTVNYHVEKAKRKFGVATRIQAVMEAVRKGVIAK
jgi:DNA-binding CsgD family transcriptional regulator